MLNSTSVENREKFYLHIIHDAENCYCPREICNQKSTAVKIRNAVLAYVLDAFITNRGFTFQIDPIRDVYLTWDFVLHLNENNQFHPTSKFIEGLGIEINHLDPGGQKRDLVDVKIMSLLKEYGTNYADYTVDRKQRSILVLISGDQDYQCEISSLLRLGVMVILLFRPSSQSACLQNLVGESLTLRVWDSIIESVRIQIPSAPSVGRNGQSIAPTLPLGSSYGRNGLPSAPNFGSSGLPSAPNFGNSGLPSAPNFGSSGLPSSPNLRNNGLPSAPNFGNNGLPSSPNFGNIGQLSVPNFGSSGLPSAPNFGNSGQLSVPTFRSSGLPSSPNFVNNGLPSAPNFGNSGQLSAPNFGSSGLPSAPNFGNSGLPSSPNFVNNGLPSAPNFGISEQSIAPSIEINEINEINLYLSYPELKDRVQAIGLKNLCDISQGSLSYSEGTGAEIPSIGASEVYALMCFIRKRGGRIKASDVSLFYKELMDSEGKVKNRFKGRGGLKDICEEVEELTFEVSINSEIGYGHVSCNGAPPDNYDIIMKIVGFVISQEGNSTSALPESSMTRIVKFTRPQFRYADRHLKREIGAKLTDICRNVEMCWDRVNTSIAVRYLPEFIDEHTITTHENDLNDCKIYLERVKASLIEESKISNISLSDTDLKCDKELKNLLRDKQVYMHIALKFTGSTKPKPIYSLIMYFPKLWGTNEEILRQHIINFIQKKLDQPAQISVGRIVVTAQPHALITVESDKQKVTLLKSDCSDDDVKLERFHDDEVDVILVCPSSYYNCESKDEGGVNSSMSRFCTSRHKNLDRCDDCGWLHVVRNHIKDLQRVGPVQLLDTKLVSRITPNPSDVYGQKALKDFLGYEVASCILLNDVVNEVAQVIKRNDPGSNDLFLANLISIRKDSDLVELFGIQKYVSLAENFLLSYIKSALVNIVYVPKEKRNNRYMFEAVKSRCLSIATDGLNTSDADTAVIKSDSNDSTKPKIPCMLVDSTSKEYVAIVAWPQFRGLWRRMSDEVKDLVDSFTVERIPMTKTIYIQKERIKKMFGLVKCSVDQKVPPNVVVSGKKNSVDSAKEYVTQMLAGSTLEYLGISCPDELGGADAAHYLRLPGLKPKILKLCVDIKAKFPRFSATVSGTTKGDDDNSVLTLQGPHDSASSVADFTLAGVKEILLDTKLYFLTFPEHEVQWLIRNGGDIGAGIDAWIRLGRSSLTECPSDAVDDSAMPCLNKVHSIGSLQVFVAKSDFKNLSSYGCDIIINPSNHYLRHIGGLAKAIADEAGQALIDACTEILNCRSNNALIVGEAVTTAAYNLSNFKHIVHVVAPSIDDISPTDDQKATMRVCIYKALNEATTVGATCLAVPGVGAGIFCWPVTDSANEIVQAIKEWVKVEGSKLGCSLNKIVLFDSSADMVAAFSSALEMLGNDEASTSSDSVSLPNPQGNPISFPGPPPTLPEFRWFWMLWGRWENVPTTACDYNYNGNQVKIVPYDYDQVLQLEEQYALNKEGGCLLQGDIGGVRNGNDYNITFTNMKQTTVERPDKPNTRWSERPIFRLPSKSCSVPLPLFEERVQNHSKCLADYEQYLATVTSAQMLNEATNLDSDDTNVDNDRKMPAVVEANNIFIFGKEDAFVVAKNSIIDAISCGRRSKDILLNGVRTTDTCLDVAVQELSEMLKEINSEIMVMTDTPWKVSIRAMGEIALNEAMRLVNQYENEKMIEHHQVPLPPNWSPMVEDEVNKMPKPILVELLPGSAEYEMAYNVLCNSPGDGVFKANILKIERVQNVDLYNSYYAKCREIARINEGESNVCRLKHGTRKTDPKEIWESGISTGKYGFDFRFSLLKDKQNYYGNGSYFAEDFSYSDVYASTLPEGSKQMFIALVCCGRIDQRTERDYNIVAPAAPFSSVRGPIYGSTHYGIVVYVHHQSYPEYLVTYVNK